MLLFLSFVSFCGQEAGGRHRLEDKARSLDIFSTILALICHFRIGLNALFFVLSIFLGRFGFQ